MDGTSIDGLEELCQSLGLEAEQLVVPRDHLLVDRAKILPCIAVIKNRLGPHFVTVWSRVGPWIQVMDPTYGRRWQLAPAFLRTLMPFAMPVDAASWRGWAETDEYTGAMDARLAALGLGAARRSTLLRRGLADPEWRGLGVLDASIRFANQLMQSRVLRRGDEVFRFLEAIRDPARRDGAEIPEGYWSVRPTAPSPDGAEQISLRGAVILRARWAPGQAETAAAQAPREPRPRAEPVEEAADTEPQPAPERAASPPEPHDLAGDLLDNRDPSLRQHLIDLLRADRPGDRALLFALGIAGSIGVVIELVLFRTLIELLSRLGLASHRAQALAVVLVFSLLLLLLEVPAVSLALRAGRHLELRFRIGFSHRLPRLADGYLQSRLVSDLAGRIQHTARIRQLPDVLWQVFHAGWELVATAAAIAWLDPRLLLHLIVVLAVGVLVPLLTYSVTREHDYRVRNLSGSMFRFYLDSLQGMFPVLTHGAERGMQGEHDQILNQWESASHAHLRARMWAEGAQLLLGLGSAVWLVRAHLGHAQAGVGGVLLVVYLALNVPAVGQRIALLLRQVVRLRNHSFALLETLAEPMWRVASAASDGAPTTAPSAGLEIELQDVTVLSGGKELLSSLDLTVQPGEHVAIVGPSGAGKSSLFGLFLGWMQPTRGRVLLDGQPASPAVLSRLAADTAWVDPATQLWNRPLLDNLTYAAPGGRVGAAIDAMDLRSVLDRLPNGLQSSLGEGGRLLSGGEGQRARLGRAYLQRDARLVLLDEAFRGLDVAIRQRLLHTTRTRWRNATLLCVTHDIEEALTFDRVLVIEDGQIVEDGDPRVLAHTDGSRYQALLVLKKELQAALGSPAWRQVVVSSGKVDPREGAT